MFTFPQLILLTDRTEEIQTIKIKNSMKKILLIVMTMWVATTTFAQDLSESMSYKVTNFAVDGEEYEGLALENDIALTFYYNDDGDLMFANHWRKARSQSYGPVFSFKTTEYPETSEEYAMTQFKFTWYYFNTYDDEEGEVVVTIQNIHIGNTIKFVAEILPLDTNEVVQLRGYLE